MSEYLSTATTVVNATAQEGELEPIAVIGMACRVPGASNLQEFWANLRDGVESIRFFTSEEALAAGASPRAVADPQHVAAAPVLDNIEDFDAALFGMTKREAEILDPQHRVLLECAAAALDHAGYDPAQYPGEIGMYGGVGSGEYQWYHLLADKDLVARVGHMAIALANNTDYASTLVSYRLNLRGPSLSVSTACSTGLVAIHLACEAVRNGECDMALAGAASVELTQLHGYVYQEGSILSPDGHCRAFDADAKGTLWGSGGGVVLLKRLSDALADGDTVHAVILGSAINNDGSDKVGFSAPSVSGQAQVIRQAMGVAGVESGSIGYVEAHGTGTTVGDPIEIRALAMAFSDPVDSGGDCRIGTVKPNIGHLAAAAGVVGLIKTVLSLEHETVPPTLHFTRPNPTIDFENTPFRVVAAAEQWRRNTIARRAGVSSFGMGGTNAHAIVQEAPAVEYEKASGDPQVILLSAQTQRALEVMSAELAAELAANPDLVLDDVAHTLQVGRRQLAHRRALVAGDRMGAADVLRGSAPRRLMVGKAAQDPPVVFMFPGQGTQYVGMAGELYEREPIVRDIIDSGAELLRPTLGLDIRDLLFADDENAEAAGKLLQETRFTQPALFLVEYALARLWMSWGVRPRAMLGHSLGEYVAACLAGVFDFADGLRIVAARASAMQSQPGGAMLAVQLDQESLELAGTGLDLAAINAPSSCVVSGPTAAIDSYERALTEIGVPVTRLRTSHAFHSELMKPACAPLVAVLEQVDLNVPGLPVMSNLTGSWLTDEQAVDPAYWAEHLCSPVLFGPGLQAVLADTSSVLLEVGPGHALSGLARTQMPANTLDPVSTMSGRSAGELDSWLTAAARLWTLGVGVDWSMAHSAPRRRVPLPGHPLERQRFWIDSDAPVAGAGPQTVATNVEGQQSIDDWFWLPMWTETPRRGPGSDSAAPAGPWLVLRDPAGHVDAVIDLLRGRGDRVVTVDAGHAFSGDADHFTVRPDAPEDFEQLLDATVPPSAVLHAWALGANDRSEPGVPADDAARQVSLAFSSLVWLAQALAGRGMPEALTLAVLTCGTQDVTGDDLRNPLSALVAGPVKVLPLEFPGLVARHIDVDVPTRAGAALLAEFGRADQVETVAYRNGRRWVPGVGPVALPAGDIERTALRTRGTYVITGGLGGVGMSVAIDLAHRAKARLVLVGRSEIPPRIDWAELIRAGGSLARQLGGLLEIERVGGEILVIAADVTDPAEALRVKRLSEERFGAVHGIIHAAGIAGGTMVEAHSPGAAAAVLGPKVFGALAIAEAFRNVELDFLALFSSVTAVAGGLGQIDYCAANAFLDAMAHSTDRYPWPMVSVNWGAWLEVGMAANSNAPAAFRQAELGIHRVPAAHPLLDARETRDGSSELVHTVELSAGTHWVIDEHRIGGTPALPGTAYLEMVRAAFASDKPADLPVELRDVVFLAPLAVPAGTTQLVRVVIEDAKLGGAWRVESVAGQKAVEHARGTVHPLTSAPRAVVDLQAVADRCPRVLAPESSAESASGLLTFGPRWNNLAEVRIGTGEELARLDACAEVEVELPAYGLHPALLDEATSFGAYAGATGSYLPLGYGRVVLHSALPARLYSHLRHRRGGSTELLASDISLLDERGAVVAEISDFLLRRVDVDEMRDLDLDPAGEAKPARSPDTRAAGSLDEKRGGGEVGIPPSAGAEAFLRVLGADLGPQVMVTALHLPTLIHLVQQNDRKHLLDAIGDNVLSGDVDLLRADYLAPGTGTERALVPLWEQTIGATGIGVDHDFFDLGGNSLVAAQLIARVRTTMGIKLPMRVLFESPTIAGMAAMIDASIEAVS